MIEPKVILVDQKDNEIGQMNKLEAHEKGLLHRAISVLIFNSKGEWLLQKRASTKYHSPSLWSNTACSHPAPKEATKIAADRRLQEEMGMAVELKSMFQFTYRVAFGNGLTEHEFDHVFMGMSDCRPEINMDEAGDYKYVSTEWLIQDLGQNPEMYTEWFKILVPKVIDQL
jgi:isopentenyl-diphosphate delta-isomerase